ncbi:MAG: serine/threonine protein kinase, partial [Anaerolineae bacterium]|nr:serine/threonine protein kinase [Anaerolineae bacterium]
YLHTRKPPILHRDIKPGNVKITPDGHIFLVDFGLAKVLHGSLATTTGARGMTLGYAPPEQYGTARTDPRTDIYSLGATLYAALSGMIPEDGLARAMDNTQLIPLRKRNSKVSRRLAAAIEKAMGIDPADRFQNAEEFKRSLLASKSKTQRLPGDYMIDPAPNNNLEEQLQNYMEKEPGSGPNSTPPVAKDSPRLEDAPVFKPRRKKRKGFRTLPVLDDIPMMLELAKGRMGAIYLAFKRALLGSNPMTLEPGNLLHKRYRIVKILGMGNMGAVYYAVDEILGLDVAIKENLLIGDTYVRQFLLEAKTLARLHHPNLPRVSDHFVIGDQGQYLVMDYIDGEDLYQRMERIGKIIEDEAILIGAAICDALTFLHSQTLPILHRDIKPGNIKITPNSQIYLVDFGLVKLMRGIEATTKGASVMTPGYSPPEQYRLTEQYRLART